MSRVVVAVVALLVAVPVAGGALAAPASGSVEGGGAAEADGTTAVEAVDGRASAGTRGADAQTDDTVEKHIRLFLTPEEPGTVNVEVTYDVPDQVTSLKVNVPEGAESVRTSAFTRTDGTYEWDGETDPAVVAFTMPANQSATGARSPSVAQDGEYSFVDTGPWAVVTVPGLRTEWSWRGDTRVSLNETVSVPEAGSTGGEIAYLGPMETHTRTAHGQTFELVVPERASLAASPSEILDALAAASGQFQVGERDDHVWFVAAPTDADWGVRGVEYGGSDAWVLADSRLDQASNVWFHEYVHTRQAFSTATTGRWATEASAEYYSALLGLQTDSVGFEKFETFLSYGEREPWRSAVLADPTTWAGGANYVKGSLVWGALDRQVRLATNSTHTMEDVFFRLNQHDDRITNADVLAAVSDVSGPSIAEFAREHTETRAVPDMWTRSEHGEAFGTTPPRMDFSAESYAVEGPFRNASFPSPPTLYVGETLALTADVTNDGGQTGAYSATVTVDDEVVASDGGELAPGASGTVSLRHAFTEPGTYEVTVGRTTRTVTVREPASVEVAALSVMPDDPQTGADVNVTLDLRNPTSRYATGPVSVTLDGEEVASVPVTLAPDASTTRSVAVTVPSGGDHVIAAGGKSATVSVAMADGGDGTRSDTGIPGFGALAAVLAVLVAAALAARD